MKYIINKQARPYQTTPKQAKKKKVEAELNTGSLIRLIKTL